MLNMGGVSGVLMELYVVLVKCYLECYFSISWAIEEFFGVLKVLVEF